MSGARVCMYYISGLKYQFVTGRRSYICTYVVITGQAKQAFIANLYMSLCNYIHVLIHLQFYLRNMVYNYVNL